MMQGFQENTQNGIVYYTASALLQYQGLVHGFSTRCGGISKTPYAGLNLAFHSGDLVESVLENRHTFAETLKFDLAKAVAAEQVHSDHVQVIDATMAGAGALNDQSRIPQTDALITRSKLPLLAFFADCVPVMIYDPVNKAVGLAHSGWKGTVLQIGRKTVEAMHREFGTNPAGCVAAIGPSIGPCCYEVAAHVVEQFRLSFTCYRDFILDIGGSRWSLDLWKANCRILTDVGIPAENISLSSLCTCCNPERFFSYRAEQGVTGRLAAMIQLT